MEDKLNLMSPARHFLEMAAKRIKQLESRAQVAHLMRIKRPQTFARNENLLRPSVVVPHQKPIARRVPSDLGLSY